MEQSNSNRSQAPLPEWAPRELAGQEEFFGKLYQVRSGEAVYYWPEIPKFFNVAYVAGYTSTTPQLLSVQRKLLIPLSNPVMRLRTVIHLDGVHFTEFLHGGRTIWIQTKDLSLMKKAKEVKEQEE